MNRLLAVSLAVLVSLGTFYVFKNNKKEVDRTSKKDTAETTVTESTTTEAVTETTTETVTETTVYVTTFSEFVTDVLTSVTTATPDVDNCDVFRGAIISADGVVLWYTEGTKRKANPDYDMSVSNLMSKKSALKLDTVFNDILRKKNPTEVLASTGNPLGQSVRLTLSAEKQKRVFDYLNEKGLRAAVCLMNDDGGIEAAVSTPSFSNDVSVTSGSTSYYNNVFRMVPLGSVAKITSGVVLSFNGINQLDDLGTDTELGITNWDAKSNSSYPIFGETLLTAFVRSSNYFFGKAYADLGAERVRLPLDMFFSYSQPVVCDFGTLERSADLEDTVKRAHAAFGQRSRTTVLSTSMDAHAAVTGELVRPYILSDIVDTQTGQTLETRAQKTLVPNTTPIPEEYRTGVKAGMKQLAESSGFSVEGCNVYAKTGTAASEGLFQDDILSTVVVVENPADGSAKTMMLTVFNGTEFGYNYASDTKAYVQDLLAMLM